MLTRGDNAIAFALRGAAETRARTSPRIDRRRKTLSSCRWCRASVEV